MSKQYPGGLITKSPVTPAGPYQDGSAPGIWTLNQAAYWTKQGLWPTAGNVPTDPYFEYVTMLLHGNGSASGTTNVLPFNSDASTNAFNATINGDTKSNNFNPFQEGYYSNYFDGSGDYLTAASNAAFGFGTGDFTAECWVYPVSWVGLYDGFISTLNSGTAVGIHLSRDGVEVNGVATAWGTTLSLNTWTHLALTRSGTSLRLFVNGALTNSGTNSANIGSSSAFAVGRRLEDFNNYYCNAYISNARIVKGTAVYTSAFTPSTTPLTAISGTSVLTCQSNRFIDNSTNNFTITKNGDTAVAPAQPFTLPSSVATYGSGYFDGTGDYLSVANNTAFDVSSGQEFTIEFWWNPDSLSPTYQEVVTKGAGLQIYANTSTLKVALSASNSGTYFVDTGAGTLTAKAWNHIALVRSGNNYYGFLNGVRTTLVTTASSMATGTDPFLIGVYSGALYPTNGYISNVRFVKGTAVYTSAFTPPTTPLTAISGTSLLTTQYNGAGNNNGFKDSSQNNFVITRNGNTTQGTFTPYGANWSNYFDGSGDYLSTPSSSGFDFGTGDFTVEAWINTNILTGEKGFIQTSATAGGLQTSYTNGVIAVVAAGAGSYTINVNIGGTNVAGSIAVTTGTWYHVAFTRSSGVVRSFINGALSGGPTTITANLTGTYACVGGYYSTGYLWSGYISNLRVVKGTALYTSAFTPSTTPLTAISGTSLLTCADNRFIDDSTNNFTITRNGDVSVQRFSPFNATSAYSTSVIGGSGYFDGTGDYLSVANTAALGFGTGDFTIEFSTYMTSAKSSADSGYVFDLRFSSGNTCYMWLEDNTAYTVTINGVSSSGTTSSTYLRQWVNWAIVRSSGTVKVYVNGVQNMSFSSSGSIGNSGIAVGCRFNATEFFPGYITDFRVVKGTAVYTTGFTPPTAPLTAITNTSLLTNFTNAGILDNAMMSNQETLGNAMVSTSIKKFGNASMYFDGTADRLTSLGNPAFAFGTGDFTIEGWFYINSGSGANNGALQFSASAGGLQAGTSNSIAISSADPGGGNVWGIYYANTVAYGSATSTQTWIYLALVRSSGSLKLYINGTADATFGTKTDTTNYTGQNLCVGGYYSTAYLWNGYIDDLRVTKYARYTTNFTAPTSQFFDQ